MSDGMPIKLWAVCWATYDDWKIESLITEDQVAAVQEGIDKGDAASFAYEKEREIAKAKRAGREPVSDWMIRSRSRGGTFIDGPFILHDGEWIPEDDYKRATEPEEDGEE
jgi:hypothetical protein